MQLQINCFFVVNCLLYELCCLFCHLSYFFFGNELFGFELSYLYCYSYSLAVYLFLIVAHSDAAWLFAVDRCGLQVS